MSKGDVWETVISDMKDRRELGIKNYGCPVNIGDMRKTLKDAYEEALDKVAYIRLMIFKIDEFKSKVNIALDKSFDTETGIEIKTLMNEYL